MSMLPSKPALGLHDIFLMMPDHADGVIRYYEDLMRGPSELTPGERELIYSYSAALQGCHYPYHSHIVTAVALGIDPEIPKHILTDFEHAPLTPRLRAILSYARRLAIAPGTLERRDADALYAAGCSEALLFDIVRVGALASWIGRITAGLGVTGETKFLEDRGRALAEGGYQAVLALISARLGRRP
jgi:uncharacterized peroxidase-related enzyme